MQSRSQHRTTIYDGRVFRVEKELAALPGGRRVTMEIVRHRGSVVLIPEPAKGRVILIRQYRHVLGRWIWELPAGTLEAGEPPARAARRECEEEIGLRPRQIERLGVYYPTPGFCDERMVFYACRDLYAPKRPAAPDADEQIEPRTFTMREAWGLVQTGEVVDMKTTLGLAMIAGRVPLYQPGTKRGGVRRG
jgi:ADP-ribose pyrophosphatase